MCKIIHHYITFLERLKTETRVDQVTESFFQQSSKPGRWNGFANKQKKSLFRFQMNSFAYNPY